MGQNQAAAAFGQWDSPIKAESFAASGSDVLGGLNGNVCGMLKFMFEH